MRAESLRLLSQQFLRFASEQCRGSSPLYERLSSSIAEDPELLELASCSRKGERTPNLFLAAVHFLLLKGIRHPVSEFYKSISSARAPGDDPYPEFRAFCLERAEEIRRLISVRLVQTNEVKRCAGLAPALAVVSRLEEGRSLALVELGASAGLLLLWDRYGYKYGDVLRCGDESSPVQIACGLKGDFVPPVPDVVPEVSFRLGVDLNPLDARDPDAALWLQALVWPEHEERAELLRIAIGLAQENPPRLIAGDALEILPKALAKVPDDAILCVIQMFTRVPREPLDLALGAESLKRDLWLLQTRPHGGDTSELWLGVWRKGMKANLRKAYFENHGEWIEWLGN
jgi:hypothetical protein